MRKLVAAIRSLAFCGAFASLPCPLWATEPCVDGYGGYGTPEQEERWYKRHVQECLQRIMAYPKTKGRVLEVDVQSRVKASKAVADWWAARDDEWLYGFIPTETPEYICVGYSAGCPIHGGMRGAMRPDVMRRYHYQCVRGKEWWYPSCKVKNPTTGEEVMVVDKGKGWTVPKGFPAAGVVYHFKQAWPYVLLRKYLTGSPTYGGANRPDPRGRAGPALSYMYAATGDLRYAHAQGILLNRLAEVYRTYYSPRWYKGGTRWRCSHRLCPGNWEPDHIQQICVAFDLVFEALLRDASIVKFFATKGDADYNGDGRLTPEDITYNIQKNLLGYMYELMHRFPTTGQGADKALCAIAVTCQNPLIVADALELLTFKVENQIHRDGMYLEDSSGYRRTARGYVVAAKFLDGFCDGKVFRTPIDLFGDPAFKLNKYEEANRLRTCDGRLLAIGDTQTERFPVGPTPPQDGKLTASVLFDGPGLAILRSGANVQTRKHLLVYFAQSGCGHGHADQLHLQPIAYGYDLSMQIGYWARKGRKRRALQANTTNHNTVEVDLVGQRVQSIGTMRMYAITDHVKVCEADAHRVYEQCTLYRRMAALIDVGPHEHFVADVFRVVGGKTHDYLWHSLGGDDAGNFDITTEEGARFVVQEKGTLLGEDVAYATEKGPSVGYSYNRQVEQPNRYAGYSWLKAVRRARTDKGWTASWLADPKKEIGLRLHMTAAPDREVILCKGEGYGIMNESPWDPYTVTRHQSKTVPSVSIFAAVIEPHRGEPFVTSVRRLPMAPPTAAVGLEPVAMIVETKRDKIFYVLHNPERDTPRTLLAHGHRFELLGQFATVCFTGGKLDYAMLANGKKLVVDGRRVETEGVAAGKILGIDVENNRLEVETETRMATGRTPGQMKVTVYNPQYSRGETFPVAGVERLSDNRYQLDLGDTYLYMGMGKVSQVDVEANTMLTKVPQSKLMNGRHLYDGRWLRLSKSNDDDAWHRIKTTDDKFSLGSETTGGVTFFFDEPVTARKMKRGDLFWVYAIGPGDAFEVGNWATLEAEVR